ncbi:MAG: RNA pseudouridine synthase [Bacteroidales bacterium]|nr:RNA pseudouridine synthase [Bacteroidales bacterium]
MSYIPSLDKRILYEDNHLIAVNKRSGEIIQGDKTGDEPLSEAIKRFLKVRDNKPGNVYLGVVHRLDRPVSGVSLFAKTSKALSRMNRLFKEGNIRKTYLALVENSPVIPAAELIHYLTKNEKQNKSYARNTPAEGAKKAVMYYTYLKKTDRYHLLEIALITGRHHQIRCQLATMGMPIKGDLKYGARHANKDGSVSLHAHRMEFIHPVHNTPVVIEAAPVFFKGDL